MEDLNKTLSWLPLHQLSDEQRVALENGWVELNKGMTIAAQLILRLHLMSEK